MNISPIVRTVKTEKFAMDCVVFGAGSRPFVILPGIAMKPVSLSAASLAGAFSAYAEDYTVYVFDRKQDIRKGYTVFDMAEDTADAMRALGISDADVFGASQGGMIAQTIAIRYPELVHKMVLASTASRPNDVIRAVFPRWIALAEAGDVCALNRAMFEVIYSPEYRKQYDKAFAFLEGSGTPGEVARLAVLAEACLSFDVYDELKQIRCPTLVVGSRCDHTLSPEASVEIADALGCERYLYEGYSHAVYDEAPDFRGRMLSFLRKKENAQPT